ncbi:MAG: prepilin-type N-terminal cleavage/methylation domain-containing protein [Planctomycetaceae bacterium]|nr:prepilin-type N-terminal cleavage/methylation domain-containing protein [Planctomycetaceae bacterium]
MLRGTASVRPRSGFTLVEVLLALGLTAVLMLAVSGAITLYARTLLAGRERTEQSQVVRAVLRLIELDLRSVTFAAPPEASEEEAGGQAADEGFADEEVLESQEMSIQVQQPSDGLQSSSTGIVGDATQLVLHLSRPLRAETAAAAGNAGAFGAVSASAAPVEPGSDLRSVAWFLAAQGAGGLAGAAADQALSSGLVEDVSGSGVLGLARLDGDRLVMQSADATGDLQALATRSRVLAPEVVSLGFRYFDGQEWFDVWNSVELGRLPLAVEVTVGLASGGNPASQQDAFSAAANTSTVSSENSQTWRLVVPLAQAERPLLETGL